MVTQKQSPKASITDLSTCTLEPLRQDAEFILYRGCRDAAPGQILVLAPVSDQPEPDTLRRLEHEYALGTRLVQLWAARPLALVRDRLRTMLVLEDPGGEPLDRYFERPLDLTVFLQIAISLAGAVRGVHEQDIVHKDIRPANILVDRISGHVWLTGFGIASELPRERQPAQPGEDMAGSLAYMAPEQTGRMNRSIDARSDLYSVGVTLYQALTGMLPFTASDPIEWFHCHIARQPLPPIRLRKEIPETLSAIVMKLLAKTAEERYQTAAGLETDFRKCLADWKSLGRIEPFVPGSRDTSDRLLIPEKLYGRDQESAELLEAFDRVLVRGTPEFVLVSGDAGVGKSSFVNELRKAIVLPRGIFISGKFDENKREVPYATLTQALRSLARDILGKRESELAQWKEEIRNALGPNAQLVTNLIPEVELIIGNQPPVPELPAAEMQNRFRSVLRALLRVFARKEHPLVLFLDDLQWLDQATLSFIEHLVTHADVRHLLLIGAYRSNGISPAHPFMLALDSIRKSGAIVRDIVLAPLSLNEVGRFIADSLHEEPARVEPLAQLVHEKTAGNPFFTIQFLAGLAEERLIKLDPQEAVWRYDAQHIRTAPSTDNVIDLLVGKLNRLPPNTLEILKQLACLGSSADAAVLALVHGRSEQEIQSDLWEAIRGGFVVQSAGSYNFVHDRVREAAYSLMSQQMRTTVHLGIGRLLMAKLPAAQIAEKVFDIVNQFNRGAAIICDWTEKQSVGELNLRAAKKAKAATGYRAACTYFSSAMTLLGLDYWNSRYDLAFTQSLERAECEFLSGNFDTAETLSSKLLVTAKSKNDRAAVYCLRIDLRFMKSEHSGAVDSALGCLRMLGIEIPDHPTAQHVEKEFEKVLRSLGERPIESLLDLPPMKDPQMRAAVRVLSLLYGPAFTTDKNVCYLSACHMASITLKYGITDASAYGLALFGRILGPLLGRFHDGYLWGKLAAEMVGKYGFIAYKARVHFMTALSAIWIEPITAAIEMLEVASRFGVEMGDLVCMSYSHAHFVPFLLTRGDRLDEIAPEVEKRLDLLRNSNFLNGADEVLSQQQFIRCVQGQTIKFSSFNDSQFDEVAFEAHLAAEAGWMTTTCRYWILKLQAKFLSGHYETAVAMAERAKALLWANDGCIQLLDYHYYAALSIAALFETAPTNRRRELREALAAHAEQLRDWAEHCSVTFKDRHVLVAAELARLEGRELDAMRLYQKAIEFARENGFVHNEAVANEVAAKFYFNLGFETLGNSYIRNARSCYVRWGAHAKVKHLGELYPILRWPALGADSTSWAAIEQIDFTSVIKALQAVSREIDRGKLIETLMVLAIEHAGAERCLLFLQRGPEQGIEAEAKTSGNSVNVLFPQTVVIRPAFPESILRYVTRTQDRVILDDASAQNRFSDDAYLLQRRPRSILCVPLVKRRELIGVLYLENNLAPRVFSPDRLTVLELLASQAAISLKNALLYADLQQENRERQKTEEELKQSTAELDRLQSEMRQSSRAVLMGELTASLAHEVNQPLAAIFNNVQAARRLLAAKKPNLQEVKECLDDILQDNSRAIETIKNVRALFQRDEIEMSSVDFLQLMRDVERIVRLDAAAKNIKVRLALPDSLPSIVGNRTQLIQALINLILNAFDAICQSVDGPREVQLNVTQDEAGWLHIAVRDSGTGFDPAIMPLMFDPFFTTKPKGMGMGLSIVRSIIEIHGGVLRATRNPDCGATLEFTLPINGGGAG